MRCFHLPYKMREVGVSANLYLPCVRGDSPQCGEMSRSDRGDRRRQRVPRNEAEGLSKRGFVILSKCKNLKAKSKLQPDPTFHSG